MFLVFLLTLCVVSSFLTPAFRVSNTFPLGSKLVSTRKWSEDANVGKSVGGIYEYRSDDGSPPPELAALFGLSVESGSKPKKPRKIKTKINSATTTLGDSVTTTFTQTEYVPRDLREAKKKKNERERRIERRERKDAKLAGQKPKKAKVVDEIPMDKLELQLLSKYGANAYREALEDYEETEAIRQGNRKKFGGFMGSSSTREPLSDIEIEQAEMNEQRFYEGSRTMSVDTDHDCSGDNRNSRDARPCSKDRVRMENEDSIRRPLSLFQNLRNKSKGVSSPVERKKLKSAMQSVEDYYNSSDDDKDGISEKSVERHDAWNTYESDMDYDSDLFSNDSDDTDAQQRSGPLNAVHGFRLRPISPISAEEQAKIDTKNARLKEKEEAKKERKKAKRVAEKNEFAQFTFRESSDAAEGNAGAENSIFSTSSWAEIGVTDPIILENLQKMKIFSPTKIQALAIPPLDNNEDVLLQAQTGCGKTLAFLLPLFNIIDVSATKTNIHRNRVQCIILAPSRELVMQIGTVANQLFKNTEIRCETIIGGANVRNQVDRLRDYKPSIVVATPGRLAEIIFRLEKLKLSSVRAVIVDEVDNMFREPYLGEMESILENVPAFKRNLEEESMKLLQPHHIRSQEDDNDETAPGAKYGEHKCMVCLASATTKDNERAISSFSRKFGLTNLKRVSVELDSQLPSGITHALISTPRIRAIDFLKKVLNSKPTVSRALIFVNDPHRVEVLVDQLYDQNIIAAPLHGDSSKEDRREILDRVRDGRLQLVVTTELAARGLDIPELSHVINFELPTDAAHYVHRAGRCGRAGRQGLVINFANPSTKFVVRRFGKQLGAKVLDCEIRDGQIYLKQR